MTPAGTDPTDPPSRDHAVAARPARSQTGPGLHDRPGSGAEDSGGPGDGTDQPAGGGTPPASSAARGGLPRSVVVLLLVIVLIAAATAATALLGRTGGPDLEQAREQALQATRERTLALTSYDHRTLDADFAEVLATATGPFEQEYTATTAQLRPVFVEQQAVATSTVVAAGLESATVDRAVAVVAVDQVIATLGAAPRTERNRLRMTLVRADGTWLVERVERL